jgi:hypothetical protein
MNSWLHENIGYERREEGDVCLKTHSAEQRLCGICGVLAEVWVHGLLHAWESGYLWEDDPGAVLNTRKRSRMGERIYRERVGLDLIRRTGLLRAPLSVTAVGLSAPMSPIAATTMEGTIWYRRLISHCEILRWLRWMEGCFCAEAIFISTVYSLRSV